MRKIILAALAATLPLFAAGTAMAASAPEVRERDHTVCVNGTCTVERFKSVDGRVVLNTTDKYRSSQRLNSKESISTQCSGGVCTERTIKQVGGRTVVDDVDRYRQRVTNNRGRGRSDWQDRDRRQGRYGTGYRNSRQGNSWDYDYPYDANQR